jgi:ankyrin repeat protein
MFFPLSQVELLLAAGAKGAAKNSNGKTPLDLAMWVTQLLPQPHSPITSR